MSKKVIQKRTAYYELEQDGFSVHTFELSYELSEFQLTKVLDALYGQQKKQKSASRIYQDTAGNHVCTFYQKHGIRITLNDNRKSEKNNRCFVYMVINPRILLDPDASYRGILPPEKKSISKVQKEFHKLFQETPFESDINLYQLRRIDLCTNLHCNHKKIFRETVRVLRKLPTPPKYTRMYSNLKNKNAAREMDKHYLRFHCGLKDLVIYDKSYQLVENGLMLAREELPGGILRFELQYLRDSIRTVEQKTETENVTDLLWYFVQHSERLLVAHVSSCFADVTFCQLAEIESRIANSDFKQDTKAAMQMLANELQRKQSVDAALNALKKHGVKTAKLLDRFYQLGISPIPLWKNFCAKQIPGPVELLRNISAGEISIAYEKIKFK